VVTVIVFCAQQFSGSCSFLLGHISGKAQYLVDASADRFFADKSAFAFYSFGPALLFYFEQCFSGGGVADFVFAYYFIFGGNSVADVQLSVTDFGYDILTDLIIFGNAF
jgi:hypothetical protein